jgi:hypothetical protein
MKELGAEAMPALSITVVTNDRKSGSTLSEPYAIRIEIVPARLEEDHISQLIVSSHREENYAAVSLMNSVGLSRSFFR